MGGFGGRMRHWGELVLASPLAFIATFALGAAMAFVYSYAPLHTVKNRKLERLDKAVIAQELTIEQLEHRVYEMTAQADAGSNSEEIAALTAERDDTKRASDRARADLKKSRSLASKLERERDDWKRKASALETRLAEASAPKAAPPAAVAEASELTPAPATGGAIVPGQDAASDSGRAVAGSAPPEDEAPSTAPAAPAP